MGTKNIFCENATPRMRRMFNLKFFIFIFLFSQFIFVNLAAQNKPKKIKDLSGFVLLSGGIAIPTQHFASVYGDYYYHNASGFAKRGTIESVEAGLNFPQENCEVSVKTNYCTNPFDMNAYVQNQKEPPTQIYLHPGGPGVNYSAISSGEYKYVSCLLKVESEYAIKKFSFGFLTAIGTSKFLSYPDVKIAMDSASNHVVVG